MATYYVDKTTGSDSDSGLTELLAWETINKVNISSFNAGDTIKFKRGEVWREDGLEPPSSGTSGNEITFIDYGSGALPIIDASKDLSSASWTQHGAADIWYNDDLSADPHHIWLNDLSYIEAADEDSVTSTARWYWDNLIDRIYIYATSNPTGFYSTIDAPVDSSAFVYDVDYVVAENLHLRHGRLYVVSFAAGATYNELNTCTLYGCGTYAGINLPNTADNNTIDGCTADGRTKPTERSINLLYVMSDNNTIKNSVFSRGGHTVVFFKHAVGNLFEYNEVYSAPGYGKTMSTQMEGGIGGNNIIRYNYVHDCYEDHPRSAGTNQFNGNGDEIYYNIFSGSDYYVIYLWSEDTTEDYMRNCKFYNNIIYGGESYGVRVNLKTDLCTGNEMKNNIIMGNGTDVSNIQISVKSYADRVRMSFINNCAYDSNTSTTVDAWGTGRTVAYMETNYSSYWSDNMVSDPSFIDAEGDDFHIQAGSPCIDEGVDVSLTQDYEGNTVPMYSEPDIGAYEYIGLEIHAILKRG